MPQTSAALLALFLCAAAPRAPAPAPEAAAMAPSVPRPERERAALRERITRLKLDTVLGPAMKAHDIQLWIVLTREDAVDPVFPFVTPDGAYPGSRSAYLFVDEGGPRPRRVVLGSHPGAVSSGFFDEVIEARGEELAAALRALADRLQPRHIAVDKAPDTSAADGLSASGEAFLRDALGPHAARLVPAEPLVIDYLETRLPEERPLFAEAAALTRRLWEDAFSSAAVVPGKTTVGDLLWRVRQRMADAHLGTWFRPDLRLQRRGVAFEPSMIADDAQVIEPGDLLHLDLGVTYLGYATDYQRMAYVARPGEKDAPPGLRKALAATTRLQDLLLAEMRPGRPGFEVHEAAMAKARAEGLEAMIYSHSVGNFGHFVGAAIGAFRPGSKPGLRASLPLRAGSSTSIELNTATAVPEWGGQKVFVMLEDDAWLSPDGMRWFVPRQERWIVIR
jgi:Xaa-Pro aminopeptidase